jgi:hypothetical protein
MGGGGGLIVTTHDGTGVYILIKKRYFSPRFPKMISPPPLRNTSFFDSCCAFLHLFFPILRLLYTFSFLFLFFLSVFLPFIILFFPFSLSYSSFSLPLFIFVTQMASADISLSPGCGGVCFPIYRPLRQYLPFLLYLQYVLLVT